MAARFVQNACWAASFNSVSSSFHPLSLPLCPPGPPTHTRPFRPCALSLLTNRSCSQSTRVPWHRTQMGRVRRVLAGARPESYATLLSCIGSTQVSCPDLPGGQQEPGKLVLPMMLLACPALGSSPRRAGQLARVAAREASSGLLSSEAEPWAPTLHLHPRTVFVFVRPLPFFCC